MMENGFDSDQNCALIYPAGICHRYVFIAIVPSVWHLHYKQDRRIKGKGEIFNLNTRTRLTEGALSIDCQYFGNHAMCQSVMAVTSSHKDTCLCGLRSQAPFAFVFCGLLATYGHPGRVHNLTSY